MDEHTPAEHRTAEGSDHSGEDTPPAAAISEVVTIVDVVRVMIEDRERREIEIAEERKQRACRGAPSLRGRERETHQRHNQAVRAALQNGHSTHSTTYCRTNRDSEGEGVGQIDSPLGQRRH